MFEVQLLIPTADNNGVLFDNDAFRAFEREASEKFGGVTRLPSHAAGAWISEGKTYRDTHRVYAVFLTSLTDGAKVSALAAWVRDRFRQESVCIRYLGLAEIL